MAADVLALEDPLQLEKAKGSPAAAPATSID